MKIIRLILAPLILIPGLSYAGGLTLGAQAYKDNESVSSGFYFDSEPGYQTSLNIVLNKYRPVSQVKESSFEKEKQRTGVKMSAQRFSLDTKYYYDVSAQYLGPSQKEAMLYLEGGKVIPLSSGAKALKGGLGVYVSRRLGYDVFNPHAYSYGLGCSLGVDF